MRKRVQQTIHDHALLADNDAVIVGVSGGADSMALLDILVRASTTRHYRIIVAHVLYGVRDLEAAADRDRVRAYADAHGLVYEECDLSTSNHPHNEAWMRDARYAFFDKLRTKHNAAAIAVGHHKDDLAETILLNVLRGSGMKGLGGMRYKRDHVIRPLLDVTKNNILAYCERHDLDFGTDSTNTDTNLLRNRIRHELLPLLARDYSPQITDTLVRLGHSAQDDYTAITECAARADFSYTQTSADITFAVSRFTALAPALQNFFLRQFAHTLTGAELSFNATRECIKLITSTKNKDKEKAFGTLIVASNGGKVHMTVRT